MNIYPQQMIPDPGTADVADPWAACTAEKIGTQRRRGEKRVKFKCGSHWLLERRASKSEKQRV